MSIIPASQDFDQLLKLLIIGNSGVGKSCLLMRYSDNTFTKAFYNTIGVDFKMKSIKLDDTKLKVQIWDTAGQDRFKTITSSYYRGAHGILIVYDITDRQSFQSLKYWLSEVEKNSDPDVITILVGNKLDMEAQRKVTYDEGYNFAKLHQMLFMETSALTDNNIALVFETICRRVLKNLKDRKKDEKTQQLKDQPQSVPEQSKCC